MGQTLCLPWAILVASDFLPPRVLSNLDPSEHAPIRAYNAKTFSARRLAVLAPTTSRPGTVVGRMGCVIAPQAARPTSFEDNVTAAFSYLTTYQL